MSSGLDAYFLVGPTAGGKTAVAQYLAERHGFAILSVDSMLVYRGMDIGTAKPNACERGDVEYGGIDLFDPSEDGSVWQYREHALSFVRRCRRRNKPVIAVGGSGLYVKALIHGLNPVAGPDAPERGKWEALLEREGVPGLQRLLRERDPGALESLADAQNPRRLIRALESCGRPASAVAPWRPVATDPVLVGLQWETQTLHERIVRRVGDMMAAGLLDEAEALRRRYDSPSRTARQAIGYAEMFAVLDGELELTAAIEKMVQRTRRLVKKQRTWFRHQVRVDWIDVDTGQDVPATAERVMDAWRRYGATGIADEL